ncbi:MAG: sulfotransferase domain-containing protein [Bradymonadaceae bacterium]
MNFSIVIGAQRSGTTSLYEYLCRHPAIARCDYRKQTNFFADDELWNRGPEWYRDQWELDGEDWALEASPAYAEHPRVSGVPERMASLEDQFRFLYILRAPFDRIRSHWHHGRHTDEFDGELSLDGALRECPQLLDNTRYASQLARYDDVFGPEKTHVLTLERLSEQPQAVLSDVCEFLDVDATFEFPNVDRRYNDRDANRGDSAFLSALRSLEPIRRAVREMVPLYLRTRLKKLIAGPNDDEIEYPDLDADQRRFIRAELEEEIERLREDDRVDVSHWRIVRGLESTD